MAPRKVSAGISSLRLSNFSLNRRFWASIAIVMACSLALGLGLIARYYQHLEESRDDLVRLEAFRLAMDAVNRISAERGPTNRVLGEELSAGSASRQLLDEYRAASATKMRKRAADILT